jgi:hypothetical protein
MLILQYGKAMANREQRRHEAKVLANIEKEIARLKYHCLFPGCESGAIASHSQQKSGPLRSISQNGKVYRLDDRLLRSLQKEESRDSGPSMSLFGIGESTTFPGFCSTHENLFQPIENKPLHVHNLDQASLFYLRTVGYELSRKRRLKKQLELCVDGFPDRSNELALSELIKVSENMRVVLKPAFAIATNAVAARKHDSLKTFWQKVPRNINVSCSTCINCHLSEYVKLYDTNENQRIPFFTFNVVPNQSETHIVATWQAEDDRHMTWLNAAASSTKTFETCLNKLLFCESEDTCINPELWRSLSEEVQRKVRHGMRDVRFRGELDDLEIPQIISLT